jgi:hypothetical protein
VSSQRRLLEKGVTVLSAFWLLCCRSAQEDAHGASPTIRKITGTLVIDVSDDAGNPAQAHWLYINRRIVAARGAPSADPTALKPFQIILVPGEYAVELWSGTPLKDVTDAFPFALESKSVVIAAGQTANLEFALQGAGFEVGLNIPPSGNTWREVMSALDKEVQARSARYRSDPSVVAMTDVYVALQQSPPMLPTVYIALPTGVGGGREFDAQEVRLLVRWLKNEYWDWWPVSLPVERMPPIVRAQYDQLNQNVEQYISSAVDDLNRIADKLDQARPSAPPPM